MPSGGEVREVGLPQLALSGTAARRVCANKTAFSSKALEPHYKAICYMSNRGTIRVRNRTGWRKDERRGREKRGFFLFFFAKVTSGPYEI